MIESRYWYLTGKYLRNTLTESEKIELDNHLQSNENRAVFESHVSIWESFPEMDEETQFDSAVGWSELKTRILLLEEKKHARTSPSFFWKAVAACFTILGISLALYLAFLSSPSIELVTDTAEKRFELPDGTIAWLNRNSSLTYESSFGESTREMELNGEAYFEVTHDPAKPFIVKGGSLYTRVLGTKFNVSNYQSEKEVVVSVVEGKVQFGELGESEKSLILTANMTGSYNRGSRNLEKIESADPNFLAWHTHKLIFSSHEFSYVMKKLEEVYNIKIELTEPEINSCTLSGTFDNLPLEEVIGILEITHGIRYHKISNTDYVITGSTCTPKEN